MEKKYQKEELQNIFLNKDKDREELYSERYFYECINCNNCTDSDIENIAEWEDDK